MRSCRTGALAALLAASLATRPEFGLAAPPVPPGPADLALLTLVEKNVEQTAPKGWEPVREGAGLRIGKRIRTAPDAVARIEFTWMSVAIGPSTLISLPDDYVLSAVLEQGRVRLRSEGRDILKLVTEEAEVRGRGQVVVRRQGESTLVTALEGRFLVEAAGKTVILPAGKGTVVRKGQGPLSPQELAAPPPEIVPGKDALYVAPGAVVTLNGKSSAQSHAVEVRPVASDVVLIQRDVGPPPWSVEIPWPGAFRWRVAARDGRGLEGLPSVDGLICVDEK
jgi:hypothetical protein